MCSLSGHPRLGWVCFFIRFGEMCHCITVSAMDALQWMGAVRMRVQTADKNITIMHTTPVHQLPSWEDKSWNKSIIKTLLNLNCCIWLQYEFSLLYNAFASEKVWIRREICTDQAAFTSQNRSKQICVWILMWETTEDGLFHWKQYETYGLVFQSYV